MSEEDDTLDLTMLLPSFFAYGSPKEFPCWVLESRVESLRFRANFAETSAVPLADK